MLKCVIVILLISTFACGGIVDKTTSVADSSKTVVDLTDSPWLTEGLPFMGVIDRGQDQPADTIWGVTKLIVMDPDRKVVRFLITRSTIKYSNMVSIYIQWLINGE